MVAGFLYKSLKTAAGFEQQMSQLKAVTGATDDQMKQLQKTALDLSTSSIFSAQQIGEAFTELAKAGVSTENILTGAGKAALVLAHATGGDLSKSAEIVAVTLNQFGLAGKDAMHVADVLTLGANTSAASVASLGQSLSYTGGAARNMGVSFEDTVAMLDAMADAGLKGSRTGTNLQAALKMIAAPPADAMAIWDSWGVSLKDVNGNFIGMDKLLPQIYAHVKDLGTVDRTAILNTLFLSQGGRAMNALLLTQTPEAIKAGKSWQDYKNNLVGAGAAMQQSKILLDNLSGSMKKLKNSVNVLMIEFGIIMTPAVRVVADALTKLIQVFIRLPTSVKTVIVVFLVLIALLGPIAALFGFLIGAIAGTFTTGGLVAAFFIAIVVGILKVTPHIDKLWKFFTTLADAMYQAYQQGVKIQNLLGKFPASLQEIAKPFLNLADAVGDVVVVFKKKGFNAGLSAFIDDIPRMTKDIGNIAAITAGATLELVVTGLGALAGWVSGEAVSLWNYITSWLSGGTYGPSDPEVQGLPKGDLNFGDLIANMGLIPRMKIGETIINTKDDIVNWVTQRLFTGYHVKIAKPVIIDIPSMGLGQVNTGQTTLIGQHVQGILDGWAKSHHLITKFYVDGHVRRDVDWAGVRSILIADVKQGLYDTIGGIHATVNFVIDVALQFGKWLWGEAGSFGGWIERTMAGAFTGGSAGHEMGSGGLGTGTRNESTRFINVFIDLVARVGHILYGEAKTAAGNLNDWITSEIAGATAPGGVAGQIFGAAGSGVSLALNAMVSLAVKIGNIDFGGPTTLKDWVMSKLTIGNALAGASLISAFAAGPEIFIPTLIVMFNKLEPSLASTGGTIISSVTTWINDELAKANLHIEVKNWTLTISKPNVGQSHELGSGGFGSKSAPNQGNPTTLFGWDFGATIDAAADPKSPFNVSLEQKSEGVGKKIADAIYTSLGVGFSMATGHPTQESNAIFGDVASAAGTLWKILVESWLNPLGSIVNGVMAGFAKEMGHNIAKTFMDHFWEPLKNLFSPGGGSSKSHEMGSGGFGSKIQDQFDTQSIMDSIITPVDFSMITNPFAGFADSVIGWLSDEFDKLKNWLSGQVPDFMKDLANHDVMQAIRDVIGGGGGKQTFGPPIPPGFAGGEGAIPDIKAHVDSGGLIQSVKDALSNGGQGFPLQLHYGAPQVGVQGPSGMAGAAGGWGAGTSNWRPQSMDSAPTIAPMVDAAAVANFMTANSNITTSSDTASSKIKTDYLSMYTESHSHIQSLSQQIPPLISGMSNTAISTTGGMQQGVISKFSDMKGGMISQTQNASGGVAGVMNDLVGSMYGLSGSAGAAGDQIGYALGAGVYNGISLWVDQVASAAAFLVSNAIAAARMAAQAKSPSRKTMELGHDMVDGLILPFQTRTKEVRQEFASMFDIGKSGITASFGGIGTNSNVNIGGVHNHFGAGADEKENAKEVLNKLTRELKLRAGM